MLCYGRSIVMGNEIEKLYVYSEKETPLYSFVKNKMVFHPS